MTTRAGKVRVTARDITILAFCAALMFALKMALVWAPNIHFGALLVIIYTLAFRHKVLYIIYLYVLLEIAVFGFNPLWTAAYLYVWTLLAGAAWLFRRMKHPLGWAVLSGVFGLCFGALTAPPFLLLTVGAENFFSAFLPYWVSGIPFDLTHCAGNFALCLLLFKPLTSVLRKLTVRGEYP